MHRGLRPRGPGWGLSWARGRAEARLLPVVPNRVWTALGAPIRQGCTRVSPEQRPTVACPRRVAERSLPHRTVPHSAHRATTALWDHETSAAGGRSCGSRHAGRLQTGTFQVLEAALRRLSETSDRLGRKGRKKTCSEDQRVSSTHFTNMVSVRSPLAGCLPLPPASKQNTLPRLN